MRAINFLFLFVIIFSLTGLDGSAQNQPNILLIIADDLGIDGLDGNDLGVTAANTPTLDSLKDMGITYTNAWATPLCTPTRSAIMSGKYGIKNGVRTVPGNLDLVHESIFSYLDRETDDAYASAVIGKWHIANPANLEHISDHGVDYFEGVLGGAVNDYFMWRKIEDGEEVIVNEYATTHLTNSAIDWMGNQDQPWFLWLAHFAPHQPFHVPPADLYTGDEPVNNRQMFLATVEALDYEIGRLLNSMDEDTRENTIIIFIGDNGSPRSVSRGFPQGHSKGTLYEGGLRVPMIVTGNSVTRSGQKETGLVQVNDLYATIIELVVEDLPGGIYNSYSLRPSLNRRNQIERPYIYADNMPDDGESWAIRNQDYKLVLNENGDREFYDLRNNIQEDQNLIGSLSSQQESILAELEAEAADIRAGWSCQDLIINGDEENIDDCGLSSTQDIEQLFAVEIYPNPASEIILLNVQGSHNYEATLMDYNGKQILSHTNPERIELVGIPAGRYMIEILDLNSNQKLSQSIIVNK